MEAVKSKPASLPRIEQARDRPLRIAMVAHKFLPFIGGIEMHVQQVGSRMAALGHSVTVVTADPDGKLPTEEVVAGMQIRRVRAYPRGSDIYFSPGVLGQIGPDFCDIIHVQGYHTLTPPVAMLAALRRHIPFVMTFHSGGHSSKARHWMRAPQHAVMRPLVRQAAKLIGVSRFEADLFSERMGVPRERFAVIPNGAKFEALRDPPSPDPDRPLILSIGRLERYKGHHIAIAAFAEFTRSHPTAHMRILGEGPDKAELEAQVASLGLADRIEIGGIPPEHRQEMARTMASASLMLQMSEYEAHPIAVLEALSLGKAVLAADTSGFSEMAEDGFIRCIPLSSTPREIAAAMCEEVDHPRPVKPIDLPTWDDCTSRTIEIYREVIDDRARGRNVP